MYLEPEPLKVSGIEGSGVQCGPHCQISASGIPKSQGMGGGGTHLTKLLKEVMSI